MTRGSAFRTNRSAIFAWGTGNASDGAGCAWWATNNKITSCACTACSGCTATSTVSRTCWESNSEHTEDQYDCILLEHCNILTIITMVLLGRIYIITSNKIRKSGKLGKIKLPIINTTIKQEEIALAITFNWFGWVWLALPKNTLVFSYNPFIYQTLIWKMPPSNKMFFSYWPQNTRALMKRLRIYTKITSGESLTNFILTNWRLGNYRKYLIHKKLNQNWCLSRVS